jgi:regulatory protein
MAKIQRTARNVAMDLLSRREHSRVELANKLRQREFDADEIDGVLDRLQQEGLQSDQRFCENFVYFRAKKGRGPIRIRHELSQKGVSEILIDEQMEILDLDWPQIMQSERSKKFGAEIPHDYKEKMKQARFLQNRGFSPEAVMRLFR